MGHELGRVFIAVDGPGVAPREDEYCAGHVGLDLRGEGAVVVVAGALAGEAVAFGAELCYGEGFAGGGDFVVGGFDGGEVVAVDVEADDVDVVVAGVVAQEVGVVGFGGPDPDEVGEFFVVGVVVDEVGPELFEGVGVLAAPPEGVGHFVEGAEEDGDVVLLEVGEAVSDLVELLFVVGVGGGGGVEEVLEAAGFVPGEFAVPGVGHVEGEGGDAADVVVGADEFVDVAPAGWFEGVGLGGGDVEEGFVVVEAGDGDPVAGLLVDLVGGVEGAGGVPAHELAAEAVFAAEGVEGGVEALRGGGGVGGEEGLRACDGGTEEEKG